MCRGASHIKRMRADPRSKGAFTASSGARVLALPREKTGPSAVNCRPIRRTSPAPALVPRCGSQPLVRTECESLADNERRLGEALATCSSTLSCGIRAGLLRSLEKCSTTSGAPTAGGRTLDKGCAAVGAGKDAVETPCAAERPHGVSAENAGTRMGYAVGYAPGMACRLSR